MQPVVAGNHRLPVDHVAGAEHWSATWLRSLRLVQASIGALVMLASTVLNRVMVVELGLAAAIPAGLVAWHYAVQLGRPLWGHASDKGSNRTVWIIGGLAVLAAGGLLATQATLMMEASFGTAFAIAVLAYALIGAGAQGQVLTEAMQRIPGLRFRAVCDIWADYNQRRVVNTLKRYGHEVNGYVDYREMLDKEPSIEAVVIATPDFWHAEHTIACLEAGKHVYCEKEMSNTLDGARRMVLLLTNGSCRTARPCRGRGCSP